MTFRAARGYWTSGALLALFACSGEESRPDPFVPDPGGLTGGTRSSGGSDGDTGGTAEAGASTTSGGTSNATGGTGDSGGTSAEGGSSGGGAGTPSAGGEGGSAPAPSVCGDGSVGEFEDCEPEAFEEEALCVDFGFDTGVVQCGDDCFYDFADCDGEEACFDARDNDGDGDEDCDDEECADACSASCDAPSTLDDPSELTLDNSGHAGELQPSCSPPEHGPELVYRVEATESGVLDVSLGAGDFPRLTVSLRTDCADDASELACGESRAVASVTSGDVLYVVIQGSSEDDQGSFELSVRTRAENVCGDGNWDAAEACDDGDQDEGDGCDADCALELTETEPNAELEDANLLADPFYGSISPAGDEDLVAVMIPEGPATLAAGVFAVALGACEAGVIDPYLELIDIDGETVLAENDDYDTYCPRLAAADLPAGLYYLRAHESPESEALRAEFGYVLAVSVDWCGNGVVGTDEECDDGNLDPLDGCDESCDEE